MPSHFTDLLRKGSLSDVKTYILEHPECVKEKDEGTGRLPIHNAVFDEVDDVNLQIGHEKISLLINAYPQGLAVQDALGWLPLHLVAIAPFETPNVLHLVLSSFRMAMAVEDDEGIIPLYLAI